jgi:hypothetical protein
MGLVVFGRTWKSFGAIGRIYEGLCGKWKNVETG